jgi:transposase-like protein
MVDFETFKGLGILEFTDKFSDDNKCKEYLYEKKWNNGFVCKKCSHDVALNSSALYLKQCKKCLHIESCTSGTLFHKVKFPLRKAFYILFTMSNTSKGSSSLNLSKLLLINRNTAWLFQQKIRIAMESSKNYPLNGKVVVDETYVGGKEIGHQGRGADTKQKVVIAIESTPDEDGIKRVYAMHIESASASELKKIFEAHISKSADIKTDKWSGYSPLKSVWNIQQEKSKGGENFELMNRFCMGLKGWLRGIYHHVDPAFLQKYLDEYCYRFNRSIYKETAFDKLIDRMMQSKPSPYKSFNIAT